MLGQRRIHRSFPETYRDTLPPGQLQLAGCTALRAGETVAGRSAEVSVSIPTIFRDSPRLIFHSAVYMVAMETLPSDLEAVFTDPDRTEGFLDWTGYVFTDVYNTHYATPDILLSSKVTPTRALTYRSGMPPLIQTMGVVGDDELEPDYREMVYLQTGTRLPIRGCTLLSSKSSRVPIIDPFHTRGSMGGIMYAKHMHNMSKNLLAREWSFIATVDRRS